MKGTENTPKLLSSREAADAVGLSTRTIQYLGKRWENAARKAGDATLPSSPQNGLRRAKLCTRRHRYHLEDIAEFVENATRETLTRPLKAWRREQDNG